VALLRIISPVNRGPQRATARRQYIGSCLPQEAKAPTQQDPRPTRQVYEEIRFAGSLHTLVWEGSCSPGRFRLTSCHLQHCMRASRRGLKWPTGGTCLCGARMAAQRTPQSSATAEWLSDTIVVAGFAWRGSVLAQMTLPLLQTHATISCDTRSDSM
jgi:hypothetical protein